MATILDEEFLKELRKKLSVIQAIKTLHKNALDYPMDTLNESFHAARMILHEIKAMQDLLRTTGAEDSMDDQLKVQVYTKLLRAKGLFNTGDPNNKKEHIAKLKAIFQEISDILSPPIPARKCYIPVRGE
jgi:hypothetical protein